MTESADVMDYRLTLLYLMEKITCKRYFVLQRMIDSGNEQHVVLGYSIINKFYR